MKPVFTVAEFELFERHRLGDQSWRNFKLVRRGTGHPKRNWWLGWNGERFSRGRDLQILIEHNPEIYEALKNYLVGANDPDSQEHAA